MKIMVLLESAEIRDLVVFNLETKLNVEIIEPTSEPEAIGLLFTTASLNLIVIDGNHKWSDFTKIAKEKHSTTPIVCILSPNTQQICDLEGLKVVDVLPKPKLLERLPFILKECFGEEGETNGDLEEDSELGPHPLYCRIPTALLLRFSPLKADIYIRLAKDKFVKLFIKGDVFDKDDLEKYLVQKKIRFLHLLNAYASEFSEKLERELLTVLNNDGATGEELLQASTSGVEVVHELRQKLGFTPTVQVLIKTTCKVMVKCAAEHPKLKDLFVNLAKNSDQYISVHSAILAQISCSIAGLMEWTSESTFQKLTMAAILHDITLTNPVLAEVQSVDEMKLRRKEFTEAEVQKYVGHPIEAADLTLLITEMLPDVDVIVSQHHERPDGCGFPRKLSGARISPLSALFIVAHDLVYCVMHADGVLSIPEFVEKNREKYMLGNFKKVIAALDKIKE